MSHMLSTDGRRVHRRRRLAGTALYRRRATAGACANSGLKALLRWAELPSIRFHDLRHTLATLHVTAGPHSQTMLVTIPDLRAPTDFPASLSIAW
jgi:integrase